MSSCETWHKPVLPVEYSMMHPKGTTSLRNVTAHKKAVRFMSRCDKWNKPVLLVEHPIKHPKRMTSLTETFLHTRNATLRKQSYNAYRNKLHTGTMTPIALHNPRQERLHCLQACSCKQDCIAGGHTPAIGKHHIARWKYCLLTKTTLHVQLMTLYCTPTKDPPTLNRHFSIAAFVSKACWT